MITNTTQLSQTSHAQTEKDITQRVNDYNTIYLWKGKRTGINYYYQILKKCDVWNDYPAPHILFQIPQMISLVCLQKWINTFYPVISNLKSYASQTSNHMRTIVSSLSEEGRKCEMNADIKQKTKGDNYSLEALQLIS